MSIARQYDAEAETFAGMALVPGVMEEADAMRQEMRRWLTQGLWLIEMPPEGSPARQIMDDHNIGAPKQSRIDELYPPGTIAPNNAKDEVEAGEEPAAVIPLVREAGSAALALALEEEAAAADPEALRRADLTMHVFSDIRRAYILGLVAMNPEGISSKEIERLFNRVYSGPKGEGYHRQTLANWLARYGLVASDESKKTTEGRHYTITEEGMKQLEPAGHLTEYSQHPGYPDPRFIFGAPKSDALESTDHIPTPGRHRLELLRIFTERPNDTIAVKDLIEPAPSRETSTRSFIEDLIDAQWLVTIPAQYQPPEHYPLLAPGKRGFMGYHSSVFSEKFAEYLQNWWKTRNEPVNPHELVHHRQLLRRNVAGGPDDFRRAVFQHIAQWVSQGFLAYERPASFPRNYLAANPAKTAPAKRIIGIVDGVARPTPEYEAAGLQKLFIALTQATRS